MPKIVTERDKEMILFAARNKIVSRDQLQEKFFKGIKNIYPLNRRLKVLVEMELLKKTILQKGRSTMSCFSHTKEGYLLVKDSFQPNSEKIPEESEKYIHDLTLVDIRNALSKLSQVKQFYSENEYRFSDGFLEREQLLALRELNCDGFLQIDVNGSSLDLAFELENAKQNNSVYGKKVSKIYNSPFVATLLVGMSQSTIQYIQRAEKKYLEEHKVPPRIFYSLIGNILSCKDKMTFINLNQKKLNIK